MSRHPPHLTSPRPAPLLQDNDPWHFKNLGVAFVTLFRVATLEDWTDVMYINMYGCDKYQSTYVADHEDSMYHCTDPIAQPTLSAVFWVIFALISA